MDFLELFLGESGEAGDAHFVGLVGFGIVFIDSFEILLKNFESVGILFG